MTSYAKDPNTGKPMFRDSDAPDIKQDPQEAADFAARVGSRATGTTAERNAWEFRRAGMRWWDTTLKQEFQDDGDGFKPAARVATFSYQVNGLPDTSQFYTDGSLAVLPGGTSDSFVSAVNKSSITVPAGLYDMFFTVTNSAATTGRTSSQVAAGAAVYGRSSAAIPEDTWTMAAKRYLTVETVLTFGVFKTSGGVSNLTGQLVIEKVW